MKRILLLSAVLLMACKKEKESVTIVEETVTVQDNVAVPIPENTEKAALKTYENQRFRNVTVVQSEPDQYRIRGQAQIFEANLSWVVEDGHDELKTGHQMTDAGAPEWGNFDFTIEVEKARENSVLTLILFEISAKDGSRQHELPIPLEKN